MLYIPLTACRGLGKEISAVNTSAERKEEQRCKPHYEEGLAAGAGIGYIIGKPVEEMTVRNFAFTVGKSLLVGLGVVLGYRAFEYVFHRDKGEAPPPVEECVPCNSR